MSDGTRRIWPLIGKLLVAAVLLVALVAVLDHLSGGIIHRAIDNALG